MDIAKVVHRRLWKWVGGYLSVVLTCVSLCACGQSGDLYLPPDKPAESPGQE